MFTDIVGFSRLTNLNPLQARELNEEHQKIVRLYLNKYDGIEKQTTGDGFFLEFRSAIQAMNCAIEVQQALHDRNLTRSSENKIQIRIGLHLGDIFEKNNEIFGDGVNIAARLEALAEPEGICISRNFFELVRSNWSKNKFSSVGFFKLKNIQGSIELFKFNFPWQKKQNDRLKDLMNVIKAMFNYEQWSLVTLFSLGLALLLFIFSKVFLPQFQSNPFSTRNPSSIETEIKLDKGWSYSVRNEEFKEFNAFESWRYADIIRGPYLLRNDFQITQRPLAPAIILGLVPDSHQVFLNDHYVGGSEHLSDLAVYHFDASILKLPPEKNLLVVKAVSRPNLNPGLVLLPGVQSRIGEFADLNFELGRYYFKFFILKNIFFAFSFIIFILSLTYAVYLKNKNEIFYSSLFLLLGCLGYVYYNPWVISKFDYPFLRFLRLACLIMSAQVLFSGYLAARKLRTMVSWNNFFTLVSGVFTFVIFNYYTFSTSEKFVTAYNQLLGLTALYVVVAIAGALYHEIIHSKELKKIGFSVEPYFFLFFTFLSLFNILGAFKNGQSDPYLSAHLRSFFYEAGAGITFVFAIFRITIAVVEFTQQKKQNLMNKHKDDFFVELTRVVSEARSTFEKIDRIQNLAHQFLKAEKSNLYLSDIHDSGVLHLHSSRGYTTESEKLKSSTEGVFGYVLGNRRPLLIENIDQDYRFQDQDSKELQGFKSGSCMVFPLIVEERIVGIMCFLDKENSQRFKMNDLEMGLKMSAFISLLISSSKEYQKVS